MTQLEVLEPKYYKDGVSGASGWVGWIGGVSRVFGCSFKTPSKGANFISFSFGYHVKYGNIPIRFYIGTSSTSHANASKDSPYTGEVEMVEQESGKYDGLYAAIGEANIFLLPNTTYYLWIFPGAEPNSDNSYEWFRTLNEIYVDGTTGIIRIKEGDGEIVIVPTVKENGEFVTLAATVKNNEEFSFFG